MPCKGILENYAGTPGGNARHRGPRGRVRTRRGHEHEQMARAALAELPSVETLEKQSGSRRPGGEEEQGKDKKRPTPGHPGRELSRPRRPAVPRTTLLLADLTARIRTESGREHWPRPHRPFDLDPVKAKAPTLWRAPAINIGPRDEQRARAARRILRCLARAPPALGARNRVGRSTTGAPPWPSSVSARSAAPPPIGAWRAPKSAASSSSTPTSSSASNLHRQLLHPRRRSRAPEGRLRGLTGSRRSTRPSAIRAAAGARHGRANGRPYSSPTSRASSTPRQLREQVPPERRGGRPRYTARPCHCRIVRFLGQLMTILPGESACYRCIFFDAPPSQAMFRRARRPESSARWPGTIGLLQAAEVLPLPERYRSAPDRPAAHLRRRSRNRFRHVRLRRNPLVRVCATRLATTSRNPLEDEQRGDSFMAIQVRYPHTLRKFTGGRRVGPGERRNNRRFWSEDLESRHPGLKERICDDWRQSPSPSVNRLRERRRHPLLDNSRGPR